MTKKCKPRRSAGSVLYVGEIKVGEEAKSFRLYGTHLLSLRARLMKLVAFENGFTVAPSKLRPTLNLVQPVKLEVSIDPFKPNESWAEGIVLLLLKAAEDERMRRLREGLEYFYALSNERRSDYWMTLECMEESIISVRGFPLTTRRILHDVYCDRAYDIGKEDIR